MTLCFLLVSAREMMMMMMMMMMMVMVKVMKAHRT